MKQGPLNTMFSLNSGEPILEENHLGYTQDPTVTARIHANRRQNAYSR